MKICPSCNTQCDDNALFCQSCKSGFGVVQSPAPAPMQKAFCNRCGGSLIDGVCPKCVDAAYNPIPQAKQADPSARFRGFFMSPKEKLVCVLGNTYTQNFLASGSATMGFSVVSDKRVYFRGTTYWVDGKKIRKMSESKTVDLKDVTGTSVTYFENVWMKILGWLLLIIGGIGVLAVAEASASAFLTVLFAGALILGLYLNKGQNSTKNKKTIGAVLGCIGGGLLLVALMFALGDSAVTETVQTWGGTQTTETVPVHVWIVLAVFIIGIAFLIAYLFTRINLLRVEYAGGCIGFDVVWFPMQEADTYQKQLRLAKDKAIEEAESATANAVTSAMSQFASAVSQPVGVGQPVAVAAPVAAAPASSAQELMQYADLLEKGLITREEFDEFKAGVLKK